VFGTTLVRRAQQLPLPRQGEGAVGVNAGLASISTVPPHPAVPLGNPHLRPQPRVTDAQSSVEASSPHTTDTLFFV
jgi:hypothetical protein